MLLKTISGKVIFEGYFHTIKRAVEAAIRENISLDYIDLRQANLSGAELDGASFNHASFWGANLRHANMAGVSINYADCRNADLKEACLAESTCINTDFRGSFMAQVLLRNTNLSGTKFSCPSLFLNNLNEVLSLKNSIYYHKGEVNCDLSYAPLMINSLSKPIILLKDKVLIGNNLYEINIHDVVFSNFQNLIACEKTLYSSLVG